MINIEWIDNKETDGISRELSDLKEKIGETSEINEIANRYWISPEISNEYYQILKEYFWDQKINYQKEINNELCKKLFWDDSNFGEYEWLLDISFGINIFNLKKRYPDKYAKIKNYYIDLFWANADERGVIYNYANKDVINEKEFNKKFCGLVDRYWDNIVKYLQYCEPREWTYIRNSYSIAQNQTENHRDAFGLRSMAIHFFDIFENEPEAWNLFKFLEMCPQKLENLGWKEVKSIDLDIDKWINFCFRWIMEMVKSRPDINFPQLNENPTETEKLQRENDWNKIIKEYEQMIRNYIARDFNSDWTEKEKNKTFDKVFFSSIDWDPIINMWDDIISRSVWFLSENQPSSYIHKINSSDDNLDNLSNNDDSEDKVREIHQKMLSDITNYTEEHPNEKILVCIAQHWNPDWSSSNLWSKEDWLKLANISPNIKIWSIRCFFWTAFENESIYNHKSSVSWFSNQSVTSGYISNVINYAYSKGVWFHEMEIFARMNYNYSVTSLTENMEYTNRNTWETEIWKVGLAQNDKQDNRSDISYA